MPMPTPTQCQRPRAAIGVCLPKQGKIVLITHYHGNRDAINEYLTSIAGSHSQSIAVDVLCNLIHFLSVCIRAISKSSPQDRSRWIWQRIVTIMRIIQLLLEMLSMQERLELHIIVLFCIHVHIFQYNNNGETNATIKWGDKRRFFVDRRHTAINSTRDKKCMRSERLAIEETINGSNKRQPRSKTKMKAQAQRNAFLALRCFSCVDCCAIEFIIQWFNISIDRHHETTVERN